MSHADILSRVGGYYSDKIRAHGPVAKGVDWSSPESQVLRLEQLLRVCDPSTPFTLNDYGCGYGALAGHLADKGWDVRYRGFDIAEAMLVEARRLHADRPDCTFVSDEALLAPADYTVASGIFNVKLDTPQAEWEQYVKDSLARIDRVSVRGFAFNVLTSYSDPPLMRKDLYYADPLALFDHCKRTFSPKVALLHDYPLWEFTILVRR